MGDYVAATNLMGVSRNNLPKTINENGAWVSRSFLDHVTTKKNLENKIISKEKIDVIGEEVYFNIRYFTYDKNGKRKEEVKKANFIIEGVLDNDDYLFDVPAGYDDEAKTENFYNINETIMYVSAEYLDKLYNEIPLKEEKDELNRLIHDNIAYGKFVFKVKSMDNIPPIVSDIKKMGYKIEGPYYEASMLKGMTMIVYLIFGCIGLIILIVSSIGIINIMIMAALERKKEIYIMKVIGGKNKDINSLFLFEGGFIGVKGSIVGVFAAFILIVILNQVFPEYYIRIKLSTIFITIVFSFIISLISTLPSVIMINRKV